MFSFPLDPTSITLTKEEESTYTSLQTVEVEVQPALPSADIFPADV